MSRQALTILLIEDNVADADLIAEALSDVSDEGWAGQSYELVRLPRLTAGLERLRTGDVDAVLLDLSLPDSVGLETFRAVRRSAPRLPVVVLSGLQDEALAARAVREGAQDYLVKGYVDGNLLVRSIRYAIERKQAEEERDRLVRAEIARVQAEEGQRRLAFLAEASRQLAGSLDYEAALERVAQLAVESVADACIIHIQEETGEIRQLVSVHANDRRARSLLHDDPLAQLDQTASLRRVLRSGRAQLIDDLPLIAPPSAGDRAETTPASQRAVVSGLITPIVLRGRILGAISLLRIDGEHEYGSADLALAEDLAGRVALAMDNAMLYQEIQQQVRSRDEFFAAASHDLKNPLVSIKGNAQVLRRMVERGDGLDFEKLSRGLTRISDAATRMTTLIDDLLDVARVQMGQPLALDLRPTDLVELASTIVADLEHTSERHRIVLTTTEPHLEGEWDPTRLERVLANLLSNAIKYSPNGGEIDLIIGPERRGDEQGAMLCVTDRGIGIPPADLPHVFDRFHRAENVVGQIPGTGIGLASSRQVVEQHGGTISVESTEGAGTSFRVWLPLYARAPVLSAES